MNPFFFTITVGGSENIGIRIWTIDILGERSLGEINHLVVEDGGVGGIIKTAGLSKNAFNGTTGFGGIARDTQSVG